jgi:hypothetical protein
MALVAIGWVDIIGLVNGLHWLGLGAHALALRDRISRQLGEEKP